MADRRLAPEGLIYDRQGDTTVLRPAASPTDNFVRPATPNKSELWGLVDTLSSVNPKLQAFLTRQADAAADEDKRKAQTDALVSSAKSWQEAIDKGDVQPGQSPIYQRVYEETLGKNQALSTAASELTTKWYANDNSVRNSQDPDAISKWMADNTKGMLEGKSQDFIAGFAPQLNAVKQQLVQKWVAENVANLTEANKDAYGTLVQNRVIQLAQGGASPQAIAEALSHDAIPQRFAGLKLTDVNEITAKALIAAAEKTGNTNLLKVGYEDRPDLANPGSKVAGVFNIPKYTVAAQQAEHAIMAKAATAESRALMADQKARAAGLRNFMTDLTTKMADGYQPTAADYVAISKFSEHGPELLKQRTMTMNKANKPFDPIQYGQASEALYKALQPNSGATEDEKHKLASDLIALQTNPGAIDAINRAVLSPEGKEPALIHTTVFSTGYNGLQLYYDSLSKKIDPQGAQFNIDAAKGKYFAWALDYDAAHKGQFDPKDFAAESEKKLNLIRQELVNSASASLGAPAQGGPASARPGTQPAQPGSPQGSAAPVPGAPAPSGKPASSIANSIPVDHLVPVDASASGHSWPIAEKTLSSGRVVASNWEDNALSVPDMQDVNLLRMNPWIADKNGTPLWQRFDEVYGPGAVQFFMTNGTAQINTVLARLRKSQGPGKAALRQAPPQLNSDNTAH